MPQSAHDEVGSPSGSTPDTPTRSPGNFRWVICGLLFLGTTINYMDRQIIGVLKPTLSHDLHWSETGYADIVTAFQLAYAIGYLYGGRLMDMFGVKRAYPLTAFLWSIAAAAHGLVRSITGFSVARLGLGLTEGGNFPAAIKTVGEWFPLRERALATGIFNSASNIGAIVCPLTVPWLALRFGWQASFYILGGLGLVWVVLWVLLYDTPERHPRLSSAERQYIEEGRAPVAVAADPVPWKSLLRERAAWAYMIATILTSPVWWFYLFWLPDFLAKHYHLTTQQAGFRVGVVYTISVFGSVGGGWLAARLMAHGWDINRARKTALFVCACCVLPVFGATLVNNSWLTVLLVGLAAAAHQGWSANLFTFASDTMPKRAVSSLVGMGGFAAGLASMVVAQAVGLILTRTGSYVIPFAWASTMYLFGLLFLHLLVPKIQAARAS
jgi:ACS family hexuronate transporter-like MFS transporter